MKIFIIPFTLVLVFLMCLCTGLFLSNSVFAESLTDRKALLIGNYQYHKKDWRLKTPKEDLKVLTKILRDSGFEVSFHYNLKSKSEIDEVVANFGDTLNKNTVAFIHYAGHGVEFAKESLLLGTQATVRTQSMAKREGYPVQSLVEIVNWAKEGIVSVDACRDNPFKKSERKRTAKRGIGISTQVQGIGKNVKVSNEITGVMLVYSTAEGKKADDGDTLSPFISSIQKAYASHPEERIVYFLGHVQKELKKSSASSQKIETRIFGNPPSFSFVHRTRSDGRRGGNIGNQRDNLLDGLNGGSDGNGSSDRYVAALKAHKDIAKRKHLHKEQVNRDWNDIKRLAEGNISRGIRKINAFLKKYRTHEFGNDREVEAATLLRDLRKREEAEALARLNALHEKKVGKDWKRLEKYVRKGGKKGKRALDRFLKKYQSHELGNPLAEKAKAVFEQAEQDRKDKHVRKVGKAWAEVLEVVKLDRKEGIKVVKLFLKQYKKHKLGNPLEDEARALLSRLKRNEDIEEVELGSYEPMVSSGKRVKGMEMIKIPGGSFKMGSNDGSSDEKPVHRVRVKSFYMSKTEVTVGQYRACVQAGGCSEPDSGGACNWNKSGRNNHPINCVDWKQARRFSKWAGGDLPSEAQWEYAARGGEGNRYKYAGSNDASKVGWYNGSSGTHLVGEKKKNGYGLFDLSGNVWEWTLDKYHDNYDGAPTDGTAWTSGGSSRRVYRGGSWGNRAFRLRVAFRYDDPPSLRSDYLGFRVVR